MPRLRETLLEERKVKKAPELDIDYEALSERYPGITVSPPTDEPTEIEGEGYYYRGEPEYAAEAMKIAARPAPPADFRPPEFDDTGETRFEQQIFTQIEQQFGIPGGNPYAWNIAAEDAKLPEIFNQFFAGQVVWSDRDKLDKDQAAQWQEVIKRWHVHLNDVQQSATAFYDHMMGKWKGKRKRYEQELERVRAETTKITERERKKKAELEKEKRTEERQIRKEKRAEVRKEEPSPADYKRLFDMNKALQAELTKEKVISPNSLRIYNRLAKELGEKQIVKKKGIKKGWTIPVLGWTIGAKETVEYGAAEEEPKDISTLLTGKPAGRYRVNGQIVKWDGSKVIE